MRNYLPASSICFALCHLDEHGYLYSELLLLNGGDINVQGGVQEKSPLHLAVLCKKIAACELLLSKGAQVNLPDAQGQSAAELAATCGCAGRHLLLQTLTAIGLLICILCRVPVIAGMLRLAAAAQEDERLRAEALAQARISAAQNDS